MANPTTNLSMTKPTVGGSTDTWGTTINEEVVDVVDAVFGSGGTNVSMADVSVDQLTVIAQGDLRLADTTGGQYIALQAAGTTTSYTLTMPGAVGSSGQALRASDGAGALEWYTPADVGDITSVVAGAGMTGGGTSGAVTLNVIGTADKITVSADAVTIASTYVGQTSITTLGTIATGTWEGTTVAVNQGGTGATSLTDGGVLLGSGTGAITATSVLGDGEILIGDASGDPATLDVGSSTAITILGTVATGVWNGTAIANAYLANSTVSYGGVSLALGASDATPAFNLSDATAYTGDSSLVTVGTVASGTWNGSTVAVAYGGTGATTFTDGGVLLGSGTGAITATAVLGDGEILIGDASGDPVALDVGSSTAITILGTVATGVWNGTAVGVAYGGTAISSYAAGDIIYASGSTTLAKLAKGSDTEVLTLASGVPTWAAPTVGDITGVTAGTGLSGGGTTGTVTLNVEAAQTQITSVGALGAGSITSGFGAIDVGSSSIDGGTITGTFAGNLTGNVTGNTSGTAATVTGAAQTAITSVGTLTSLAVGAATNTYSTDAIILDGGNAGLSITDNTRYLNFWATHGGSPSVGSRSNHSFQIITNDTVGLTVDTSQNATLVGNLVVSGTGPHSFGAAASGDYQVNWSGAYTATGGASLGLANFFSQTFTGAVGNTAWLATCAIAGVLNTQGTDTNIGACSSLIVNAPNINNNLASSGKPDVASAVHIVGAPTEGDVNAALYVEAGHIIHAAMATSDPSVAGALWNDSGTVKISSG